MSSSGNRHHIVRTQQHDGDDLYPWAPPTCRNCGRNIADGRICEPCREWRRRHGHHRPPNDAEREIEQAIQQQNTNRKNWQGITDG